MLEQAAPVPGRYRHYKGNEYTVLGVARHSETLEELVVYRQEYGDRGLWVRPRQMFLETVAVDGRNEPRFQRVRPGMAEGREPVENFFQGIPPHLPAELVQTLAKEGEVRIERIVSHGHCSPEGFWYDQAQHEWVLVLSGAARLEFEGGVVVEMRPGHFLDIPAHRRHRVAWTTPEGPTVWLAVHYGDRR
jgi:cupin 2 domain-containing protein